MEDEGSKTTPITLDSRDSPQRTAPALAGLVYEGVKPYPILVLILLVGSMSDKISGSHEVSSFISLIFLLFSSSVSLLVSHIFARGLVFIRSIGSLEHTTYPPGNPFILCASFCG